MSWVAPGNNQKAVVFTPMQGIGLDENWKSEGQVLADVFIHFIIVLLFFLQGKFVELGSLVTAHPTFTLT